VEDTAYEHGYAIFLCNSDEDAAKEALYIDLMQAERVAGIVISPTHEQNSPCQQLIDAGVPVVAVDRRMGPFEVDTVVIDNIGGAFELVSHLISDGHRRIGAVLGTPAATTGHERREGYLKALRLHGLPILPDLIRIGLPKTDTGYQLTAELLDRPDPPTALFTGNNLLTIGALRAIEERGLRLPDDIALAAFDEMVLPALLKPSLTVIEQPIYALGQAAARLLLKRIEDPTRPAQEVMLKPTLRIRQSCARHDQPAADPEQPSPPQTEAEPSSRVVG
jgi:DNA-binding LacI/PurR family transcriptional regulator